MAGRSPPSDRSTGRPPQRGGSMRRSPALLLTGVVLASAVGMGTASAQDGKQIVILSPDSVAALDTEAPGTLVLESMAALVNLMEPLVDFAPAGTTSPGGVNQLDFNKFEGRLAESWE